MLFLSPKDLFVAIGYETKSHTVAPTGLEIVVVILPQLSESKDYKHAPPCLATLEYLAHYFQWSSCQLDT